MSESEKKELQDLYKKVEELDEKGRTVIKVATEALYARQQFEVNNNDRKAEERSSDERIASSSS